MSTIKHLAAIMDGNRRWAKNQGLSFNFGYAEGGTKAIKTIIEFCIDRQIQYLSLYAFSLENFKRPQEEQDFLFDTIATEGKKNVSFFKEHKVRVTFVGDRDRFPEKVISTCDFLEKETRGYSGLFLNILFCYGARQELISGIKKLLCDIKNGIITENDISEKNLGDRLWTTGTPDPELIIRTGNVSRLSNFLLYQAAYSEFCFLPCMWPEITTQHLADAVDSFLKINRNFGK